MPSLVECRNVQHTYDGDELVLEDLSFTIEAGGVFGLLGKNGAGKSTTIDLLMGFLRPTSGSCRVLGEQSHALTPATRRRIGLLQEGFIQYNFMTIAELERYYRSFYPTWDRELFYDLVDRLGLPHSRKIARMSCGQRSQVTLGLIVAQQPQLMILDDYSMGLDVGYRRLFLRYLHDFAKSRDATVLLTSHVVQELDQIIDNLIVLKEGRVLVSGSRDDFMNGFHCYTFEPSDTAKRIAAYDCVTDTEEFDGRFYAWSFLGRNDFCSCLDKDSVPHKTLKEVEMSFEDAFIGLTGKY